MMMMMMMMMKTDPVRSVCVVPDSVWKNMFSGAELAAALLERRLAVFGNICMMRRCVQSHGQQKKKLDRVKRDRMWLTVTSWALQNSVLFGRSFKGRRRCFFLAGLMTSPSRTCQAVLLKIDFHWVGAGFPPIRRKFLQFCFLLNKYSQCTFLKPQIRSNDLHFSMLQLSFRFSFQSDVETTLCLCSGLLRKKDVCSETSRFDATNTDGKCPQVSYQHLV